MSKFTSIHNSFKSGKISKKLLRRQDIPALKDSCEEITNFTVLPTGVLKRRYGSSILPITNTLGDGNLYTLNYSQNNQFIVYLSNGSHNFFDTESRNVKGSTGTLPTISDTSKFCRVFMPDGQEVRVHTILTAASFKPWYDSSYYAFDNSIETCFSKLPSEGWNVAQLSRKTVFTHRDGNKMPFILDLIIESNGIKFIIYPFCFDKEIYTREASVELNGAAYSPMGGVTLPTYEGLIINTGSLQVSHPNGAGTAGTLIKASSTVDKKMVKDVILTDIVQNTNPIKYIGTMFRVVNGASSREGSLLIVDYVPGGAVAPSYLFKAIAVVEGETTTTTYTKYRPSDWGDVKGFPRTVATFRGRLIFGGSASYPNKFWACAVNANNPASFQNLQSSKYFQDISTSDVSGLGFFNASVLTDVAVAASFNESSPGDIKWVKGRKILHFGSNMGEHQVSLINNTFSVSTLETIRVSSFSSSNVTPTEGDQKIFYVADDKTNIRSISTNNRDYESTDISLSTLCREYRDIKKIVWLERASSVFGITEGGKLFGMCINEQSQTSAFYDILINYEIVDISTISYLKTSSEEEYLVLLAKNGTSYQFLTIPFDLIDRDTFNGPDGYVFLDACYAGAGLVGSLPQTITNVLWKEKILTVAYSDGTIKTVEANASGAVEIDCDSGVTFVVGLAYKSRIKTAPIEEGGKFGTASGTLKRIDRATVFTTKSGNFFIGSEDTMKFERENDPSVLEVEHVVEFPNSPNYTVQCIIETEGVEPLNISSVAYRGVTYEGE